MTLLPPALGEGEGREEGGRKRRSRLGRTGRRSKKCKRAGLHNSETYGVKDVGSIMRVPPLPLPLLLPLCFLFCSSLVPLFFLLLSFSFPFFLPSSSLLLLFFGSPLPEDGHIRRISTERSDMFVHPKKRRLLVEDTIVTRASV